ncbi:predicted protein [Naegleria gruberi]|uniref:Predicted protein n=1 Tax=Naegleria gruberi TaxID=5762 RepID=D2W5K8_NAEGR|nr:uncharacterized protein NAEGRDRAFT_54815 [Naegleria gruberi]EFC35644.1 predicted protein [Naegleria gruberi]|eukprot:XP_002668388.1 predicted protein [Naegleria gruberi strain NEG-M]
MSDCTFKPKTNSKKLLGFSHSNSNRFDSLYNMAFIPKKLPNEKTREEKEMEECTFKPNRLNTKKYQSSNLSKSVDFDSIRGIKETVGRLRKGNEERERLFTYFNSLRDKVQTSTEDYKNKKTSFKPFSFQLDKRKRSKPILYMDVNLGVGRSGRIGIHEGDKPEELAFNFAQTYKIDPILQQRLQDLIRQNMEENQHLFNNRENNGIDGIDGIADDNSNHTGGDGGGDMMMNNQQYYEQVEEHEDDDDRFINGGTNNNDNQMTMMDLEDESNHDLKIEDLNSATNQELIALSKSNVANLSIYDESLENVHTNQQQPSTSNNITSTSTKNSTTNKGINKNNSTTTSANPSSKSVVTSTTSNRTQLPTYRSKTPTMKNSPTTTLNEKRSKTPTTDRYQSNNKFKL